MLTIKAQNLKKAAKEILQKAGSDESEAEMVAGHLVRANLLGHDSHGVGMIPDYVNNISSGSLKPGMSAKLLKEDGAILVFDGQRGFGQRTAREAMEAAIAKCRVTGLVVMALRNAYHIGRVGEYGEQSIRADLISIHFANVIGQGIVAPYGGRDSRLGTNPVCIAMPGTENTEPVLLDMATSKIAVGKARVFIDEGLKAPDDMILDPAGNPTNDPGVMFSDPNGSLIGFGLHKGYGLALICELLAGVLCGGGTIKPRFGPEEGIINNMLVFLVDPKRMVDPEWMHREMDTIVTHMKESRPLDPENPVMIAGEPERKTLNERMAKGIPMHQKSWDHILEAGEKVGIERIQFESYLS